MEAAQVPSGLRTILVPTDFSENAGSALRWAIEIARWHSGRLVLLHALESGSTEDVPAGAADEVARSLARLEEIVAGSGVEVSSRSRAGKPWDVVVEAERDVEADLIVIGARGRTVYTRLLLGSTADRVLRMSIAPVLTVHPDDAVVEEGVSTILVATDFSKEAGVAMDGVLRLAIGHARGRQRLVLLHAWQPLIQYGVGVEAGAVLNQMDDTEEQSRALLASLAERLSADHPGLTVDTAVRQGYPASVIEDEAEAIAADLIAVGTHGRSGLAHLLMGSVAERVVHHAGCPVLVARQGCGTPHAE